MVHVSPLLRQHRNAALGLLHMSSFGPRNNLSLKSLFEDIIPKGIAVVLRSTVTVLGISPKSLRILPRT